MIKSSTEAVERTFLAWEECGLTMPQRQRTLMDKTAAAHNALSDSVVDKINEAIHSYSPTGNYSSLVADIDRYYAEELDKKQCAREMSELLGQRIRANEVLGGRRSGLGDRYVDVLMIVAPIVSLAELFSMVSMDDDFIGKMELAFLTRLSLPRSVNEAQGAFDSILSLPKGSSRRTILGREKSKQPFKAQMLFAFLATIPHEKGSELWSWTKQCIETCPSYLFDIPAYNESGSARPSFWLSCVQDSELAKLICDRGSAQVRADIEKALEYQSRRRTSASEVMPSDPELAGYLADRAGPGQDELVSLLGSVDEFLLTSHAEMFPTLSLGVTDDQVVKLNNALGPLQISEDVATLYKWHNGLPEPACFLGYPEPLAIEDALHWYRESSKIFAEFGWSKAWFPLANEGRSYLFTLLSEEWAESTPVYRYDVEDGELQLDHESIRLYVSTFLLAAQKGATVYDESITSYEIDEEKVDDIRLQFSARAYHYERNPKPKYDAFDPSSWLPLWRKHKA